MAFRDWIAIKLALLSAEQVTVAAASDDQGTNASAQNQEGRARLWNWGAVNRIEEVGVVVYIHHAADTIVGVCPQCEARNLGGGAHQGRQIEVPKVRTGWAAH